MVVVVKPRLTRVGSPILLIQDAIWTAPLIECFACLLALDPPLAYRAAGQARFLAKVGTAPRTEPSAVERTIAHWKDRPHVSWEFFY